jgi:hypothetical protein
MLLRTGTKDLLATNKETKRNQSKCRLTSQADKQVPCSEGHNPLLF